MLVVDIVIGCISATLSLLLPVIVVLKIDSVAHSVPFRAT